MADRVAVLAEEGCDYVPELAAPYTIVFPHHGISSALWRLRQVLKRRMIP